MGSRVRPRLLIGCVGDRFLPGVKESIMDATESFKRVGEAEMVIQPPITVMPYFGLATMRNRICMKAAEERFTHVVLIDNDVKLFEGTIPALLESQKTIVVPVLHPRYQRKAKLFESVKGITNICAPIQWAVLSCIMFQTKVFAKISPWPFVDTLTYCEEETLFQQWRLQNAQGWLEPKAPADLLRPPTNLWELQQDQLFHIQTPGDVRRDAIR